MISQPLDQIDETVLQGLIDNEVLESRTIEYKLQLPSGTGLADEACSLANASGGDLILGIEDSGGLPVAKPGLEIDDLEQEVLRFDQMIANGLEPELRGHEVQPVLLNNDRYVFVIRIPQSLNAPHRVRRSHRFYGRTSAGKYQMDVHELRSAFLRWGTLATEINEFRNQRVDLIERGQCPVPLHNEAATVIVHIIPQEAITRPTQRDAREISPLAEAFRPFDKFYGYNSNFNADGFVTFSSEEDGKYDAYTQVHRTGIVELVGEWGETIEGQKILDSRYEISVFLAIQSCLQGLEELGVNPPTFVMVSLLRLGGVKLQPWGNTQGKKFSRPIIMVPEFEIWQPENLIDVLRPAFDIVWNSAGYSRSLNYEPSGEWNPLGG